MSKSPRRRAAYWALIVPAAAGLVSTGPALARTAVAPRSEGDEIIVTARKVPEALRQTPVSVTAISADTIAASGIDSVSDLMSFAPNVDISGGIAGELQGQISIRGISTLVRNIGLETGVGIYVDGVYVGRPENFAQQLLDVEQVEIARGPQGTEFGKNTIAGVIHVQTRQPDSAPGGYVNLEAGDYGHVKAEGAVGGRVSEQLSLRGAVAYTRRDGLYRHLSGGKDAGSTDLLTWRAAAKLEATSDLSFTLRGDGFRDRGTPAFFQADQLAGFPAQFPSNRPHRINNNRPNRLSRDNDGVSLTGELDAGAATITSITAYRHSSYDAALDDDQEQVDFVAADDFSDSSKMFSQELRAAGEAGRVRYLLGAYYFHQNVRTNRRLALGADLGVPGEPALTTLGSVRTRSAALFGRLDYRATDRFLLSGGLRYTRETKRANFTQGDPSGIFAFLGFPNLVFAGRSSDEDISPTVSATYEVANKVNLYARFAQGFKSAAFNVDIASSLAGLTARPEKATSYEAGLKALAWNDRLRLNLSIFYTDYGRLQVSQVLGNGLALSNAGKARSEGLEAELSFRPGARFLLTANAALLDAEYKSFANCGVPASVGGGIADCSGNDLVLAPHFTAHAAAQYEMPVGFGDIFARIDVDHRSSVFFEPTNSPAFKEGARTLVNLRLGLKWDRWQVIGWVDNVTNETYRTYADDRSGIGVLRTAAYGEPRTYGVSLRTRF